MNPTDINTNVRLFDLVRVMRSELYEAELITDEEYSWLLSEAPMAKGQGSPSPRRLEDYDDLRAKMKAMEKELRHLPDLLDAHFERGGTIAGLATTNKARQLIKP